MFIKSALFLYVNAISFVIRTVIKFVSIILKAVFVSHQ